jgi:hypothetical protein
MTMTQEQAEKMVDAFEDAKAIWQNTLGISFEKEAGYRNARAALIAALTAQGVPEWKRELVGKTIKKTLRSYRLQHTQAEDGDHYPLVDALTPDGETIAVGENEIELLTDALYLELLAAALTAPPGVPEGFRLVPVEPTEGMSRAWFKTSARNEVEDWRAKYQAMLAAAPPAPVVSVAEAVAAEREACRRIAQEQAEKAWDIGNSLGQDALVSSGRNHGARAIEVAIRARGQGGAT